MAVQRFTRKAPPSGFYTYAYLREDGTPYYIGKGCGRRAWERHGTPAKRWNPPVDERVIFLKWGLQEAQAFAHERYLIAILGNRNAEGGILRLNFTDGGEGATGCVRGPETRQKMSAWQVGKKRSGHDMRGIQACAESKKEACANKYGVPLRDYLRLEPRQRSNMKRWLKQYPGKTGADYLALLERGTDSKTRQAHRATAKLLGLGFSSDEAGILVATLTNKQREGMYKVARRGHALAEVRAYAEVRGWLAA